MIELQSYWDEILQDTNNIEKNNKSINFWKGKVEEKKKELTEIKDNIKDLKKSINQHEIELSQKDEQALKLEERKKILKNEKEVLALERELEKVNSDKSSLEDRLIEMFDTLEEKESSVNLMEIDLNESIEQSDKDIKILKEKIDKFLESTKKNQKLFDELAEGLSANPKSKFLKLIKSANGKGIAPLEGEICGECNFKLPINIVQDAKKVDNLINCTNCGRFIYMITT